MAVSQSKSKYFEFNDINTDSESQGYTNWVIIPHQLVQTQIEQKSMMSCLQLHLQWQLW